MTPFLDRLAVPATVLDADGCLRYMNPAAQRAFGRGQAELDGTPLTALAPAEARDHLETNLQLALDGQIAEFEMPISDPAGTIRSARVQLIPLTQTDQTAAILLLAFETGLPTAPISAFKRPPTLTPRQHEILHLVAAGHEILHLVAAEHTTEEIAQRLTLSAETVRNHIRNLMRALDAHTRLEAVAAARRLGLLPAEPPRPS